MNFVPSRASFILGIDHHRGPADLPGGADVALGGGGEQLAAEAPTLKLFVDAEPAEPKPGDAMATHAFARDLRHAVKIDLLDGGTPGRQLPTKQ